MNNVIKVVFVIIGTIIGAGFASGQELYTFFYSYGLNGILGLFLCNILISIIIYKVLIIIYKNQKIENYKEFLDEITGLYPTRKYLNINFIINSIINIFLIISFYIMIAGFGAYFFQELGISSLIGCAIISIISFIVFMTNEKGVVKVNEILTPILIVFIIFIGILNFIKLDLANITRNITITNEGSWILSSILYCSYNSILLIPVLITLKKYILNKKNIVLISSISGIIIFLIALSIFFILSKIDNNVLELEMPAVYVIGKFFGGFKKIYGIIILFSIFTTTISIGISFLNNVAKTKKSYIHIAIYMCISSLLISKMGFSKLVTLLYPIFGYLGLIQIFKILIKK